MTRGWLNQGGSTCAGMHCCNTLSGHKEDSIVALMAVEGGYLLTS